jgi:hypothetical protein
MPGLIQRKVEERCPNWDGAQHSFTVHSETGIGSESIRTGEALLGKNTGDARGFRIRRGENG